MGDGGGGGGGSCTLSRPLCASRTSLLIAGGSVCSGRRRRRYLTISTTMDWINERCHQWRRQKVNKGKKRWRSATRRTSKGGNQMHKRKQRGRKREAELRGREFHFVCRLAPIRETKQQKLCRQLCVAQRDSSSSGPAKNLKTASESASATALFVC